MLDLRDDGTIGIDFEVTAEDGATSTKTIIVKPPPTLGAYRRTRAKVEELNALHRDRVKGWREDPEVDAASFGNLSQDSFDTLITSWWLFVMAGDESFKGLASEPPPDVDEWPVFMLTNESMNHTMAHWRTTPLARGGQLVPREKPQT